MPHYAYGTCNSNKVEWEDLLYIEFLYKWCFFSHIKCFCQLSLSDKYKWNPSTWCKEYAQGTRTWHPGQLLKEQNAWWKGLYESVLLHYCESISPSGRKECWWLDNLIKTWHFLGKSCKKKVKELHLTSSLGSSLTLLLPPNLLFTPRYLEMCS